MLTFSMASTESGNSVMMSILIRGHPFPNLDLHPVGVQVHRFDKHIRHGGDQILPRSPDRVDPVSYTHLDVYKRQILDNMIEVLIQTSTTYTQDVEGTVMVNAAEGACLQDMTITGDLILAPGVTGTVTLEKMCIRDSNRPGRPAERRSRHRSG